MKMKKMQGYETEGYAVRVEIEECSIEDYAKNFLHIFNTVRENRELLKVRNYFGSNDVTVYCEADAKENLIKYLKAFGEIKSCEKVLIYQIEEPEYDLEEYYDIVITPES